MDRLDGRMERAEDGELEGRKNNRNYPEQRTLTETKQNKNQRLRDLWASNERFNIHVHPVLKGEEKQGAWKSTQIMAENVL